jgi:hypothetical protein
MDIVFHGFLRRVNRPDAACEKVAATSRERRPRAAQKILAFAIR